MNRPKRRRYKDNPYYLYVENEKSYFVTFKDSRNIEQKVVISKEIYNAIDKFELDDLKELNEYDRHIEHNEISDNTLYSKNTNYEISIEMKVLNQIDMDLLYLAIEKLPIIQKRRIIKYYFEDKNEYEIAKEENTSQQSVNKSILSGRRKIKEILRK